MDWRWTVKAASTSGKFVHPGHAVCGLLMDYSHT